MTMLNRDEVADKLAIHDLAARFSDAVNRRQAAEAAALFVPEGRWEVPGVPETVGRLAIEARFDELVGQFPFLVQLLHSGTVELDGDRASARWYLTEHARDADGQGSLFIGAYQDDLVHTQGGWQFTTRHFQFLYRGRDELPGRVYGYVPRAEIAP